MSVLVTPEKSLGLPAAIRRFALLRAVEISPGLARLRAPPWGLDWKKTPRPEGAGESVSVNNAFIIARNRGVRVPLSGHPIVFGSYPRAALEDELALGWYPLPFQGRSSLAATHIG